jgi:DNA/RNA-binding protein KIN17
MPKAEKGTPKDLGNRIKAKGLQKLKFYCQMCEKQCRDANGFKCHLTSESHLRQMKIFSDNAGGILDQYSKNFEQSFIQTLRMRHGTKLVNANNVYQELIADKQHIHMNATHWTTLTEFVQYLGKAGRCVVEETDRGWFVSYIERDVGILQRKEAVQQRETAERAAEEAQAKRMEGQRIEAAKALDRVGGSLTTEATAIERRGGTDQPIKVALTTSSTASSGGGTSKMIKANRKSTTLPGVFGDDDDDDDEDGDNDFEQIHKSDLSPPPSMLLATMSQPKKSTTSSGTSSSQFGTKRMDDTLETKQGDDGRHTMRPRQDTESNHEDGRNNTRNNDHDDDTRNQRDYWLYKNIVVRVTSKKLAGGKYFRRKAVVIKVIDRYVAEVEVLDSSHNKQDGGDILRLDQEDLETVIPKIEDQDKSRRVRIVNGRYRGEKAIVDYLDKNKYRADLKLVDDGKLLKKVPFEDFSQIG